MNDIFQLAYLDPGSGSMLLQAVVGGSAGILLLIRHMWRTVRYSRRVDASGAQVSE